MKKTLTNWQAILSVVITLPFIVAVYWMALSVYGDGFFNTDNKTAMVVCMLVCSVVLLPHELLHLLGWIIACRSKQVAGKIRFELPLKASVSFKGSMKVWKFSVGALFPFVVLSVLPCVLGLLLCNQYMVIVGLIHATGCCSDIMLCIMLLPYLKRECYDPVGEAGVIIVPEQ